MYAIRHRRSKKFVYGTDKRYPNFRQKLSHNNALLFEYNFEVEAAFLIRHMSKKDYEIVEVEIVVKG